ncbi:MAG: uracil-DNA glycosylase [Thermoanaerobaculia bacterium]
MSSRACNQYARGVRANAIRRSNLALYFEEMAAIRPTTLLAGEAPSHRGGRRTGIAFVSETLMLDGVPISAAPHHILGADHGYRKATQGPERSTEASATIVWSTIRDIDPLPLLWNAFPFHPFHHENPSTNRMPAAGELAIGERFLAWIIELFAIEKVVAVGNHAAASLARMGIEHAKVRHPSQGGKRMFVDGIASLHRPGGRGPLVRIGTAT